MSFILSTASNPGSASWDARAVAYNNVPPAVGGIVTFNTSSCINFAITDASDTYNIGDPVFCGQYLFFYVRAAGTGDATFVTAGSMTESNEVNMLFNNPAESAMLIAVPKVGGGLQWRVIADDGANFF